MRSSYTATMAALQIPASLLAERVSPILVLAGGTVLAAACFLLAGLSSGVSGLLAALVIGGIGASAQHPVGSAIVSRAYTGVRSRAALGFYNFTGDLGKMAMPPLAAGLFALMAWRQALWVVAGLGIAVAALVIALAPRAAHAADGPASAPAAKTRNVRCAVAHGLPPAARHRRHRQRLAQRLSHLPAVPAAGQGCGARHHRAGPFARAGRRRGRQAGVRLSRRAPRRAGHHHPDRGVTALGIVVLLMLPLDVSLMVLPLIGVTLNGTSSVLYGSVPELVTPEARTRAFGIFYTGTIAASASAPPLLGLLADRIGVPNALTTVAIVVLATVPLAILLNPLLPQRR